MQNNIHRERIAEGVPSVAVPVSHGYGQYLPEEAHDTASENSLSFIEKYV